MDKIGAVVHKSFGAHGVFEGTIVSYDGAEDLFHVEYIDGDEEDLDRAELDALLAQGKPTKGKSKAKAKAKAKASKPPAKRASGRHL